MQGSTNGIPGCLNLKNHRPLGYLPLRARFIMGTGSRIKTSEKSEASALHPDVWTAIFRLPNIKRHKGSHEHLSAYAQVLNKALKNQHCVVKKSQGNKAKDYLNHQSCPRHFPGRSLARSLVVEVSRTLYSWPQCNP